MDRGADGVGWLRRLGRRHICRSVVGLADGAVSGEDEVFGVAGVAGAGLVGGGAVEEVAGFVIVRLLMLAEGALAGDFFDVLHPPVCEGKKPSILYTLRTSKH